eukprot:6732232-Alexandrium_andersonii.AAC.1
MSASLVGSEMCIRDSSRTSSTWSRGAGQPSSSSPGLRCLPSGPPSTHTCLLYTSDAADDM